MKILLVALALFTLGAQAQIKAPTVYGKLSKMIRYVDQDAAGYKSFTNVEEAGFPSRFGFKGSLNSTQIKVGYVFELGYDSEKTGETGISMRRAAATLDAGFGIFTIGQEWTATSLIGIKMDPLACTGVSNIAYSLNGDVAGAESWLGYKGARYDQIGYKTPKMMGFQLALSYDREDNPTRNTTTFDNGLDALLTYDIDLGSIKVTALGGMRSVHGASAVKNDTMMFGAKFAMGDLMVNGLYSMGSAENNAGVETDTNRMFLAASYKIGDGTIAASYGNKDVGDGANTDNLMALGYLYDVNKYVQLNGFGGLYKAEGTTDNDATMFGIGTTLQF